MNKKRTTFYIAHETHRKFKTFCAFHELEMSKIMEKLIEQYLENQKEGGLGGIYEPKEVK